MNTHIVATNHEDYKGESSFSVEFDAIKSEARWVTWCNDKKPMNPHTNHGASVSDPSTWGTINEASKKLSTYTEGDDCGFGFVFFEGDSIIGIDLDGVIDPNDCSKTEDWIQEIIDLDETLIELSPSGTGLHIYCIGDHELVVTHNPNSPSGTKRQGIEVYDSKRYFRCTFEHPAGLEINKSITSAPQTMEIIKCKIAEWSGSKRENASRELNEYEGRVSRFEIEDALKYIDSDLEYPYWRDIGFALHHHFEGDDTGFDIFNEWSSEGAKYDPDDVEMIWKSADKSSPQHPVTIGTLLKRAYEGGWDGCKDPEPRIERVQQILAANPMQINIPEVDHTSAEAPQELEDSSPNVDYDGAASVTMVCCALTTHQDWAGRLRHNVFTNELEIDGRPVIDADVIEALMWCEVAFKSASKAKVQDGFEMACRATPYDPVVEYLDGLEWDGVKRLDSWLTRYCGAEANLYTAAVGAKWLIGAVARQYRPGAKVDEMLVLEGKQGVGKSRALAALAIKPKWFLDTMPQIGSKDAMQALQGRMIVEVAELAAIRRSSRETLKQFLSTTEDKYRPPYGRIPITQPRRVVFAGTTNDFEYLPDSTGNRRFWPVEVSNIDVEGLNRDRDQLWAEAVAAYRTGKVWHLTREEEQLAAHEQEKRRASSPWEADIARFLEGETETCVKAILDEFPDLRAPMTGGKNGKQVAEMLRLLGWKQGGQIGSRKSNYRGQRKWVRAD